MNKKTSRKPHVKTKNGMMEMPMKKVKTILGKMYKGKELKHATQVLMKEAKTVTKQGVISATDFEKAVVDAMKKTNDVMIDTSRKLVKKMLK